MKRVTWLMLLCALLAFYAPPAQAEATEAWTTLKTNIESTETGAKTEFTLDADITLTTDDTTPITIKRAVTIDGGGKTIDASAATSMGRIFVIDGDSLEDGAKVVLKNITFKGGTFTYPTSGTDTYKEAGGGAIIIRNAPVDIENCKFDSNTYTGGTMASGPTATGGGGAVSILATAKAFTVNIKDSDFTNNTATNGHGGAVAAFSGKATDDFLLTLNVEGCSFDKNTATNADSGTNPYIMGGGLYVGDLFSLYTGDTAITAEEVVANSFTGKSAPCKITATVDNCRFTNNSAGQGGGIDASNLIMDASEIQLTVKNSLFEKNKANPLAALFFGGGGLCARLLRDKSIMSVDIDSCIFKENTAFTGGGAAIVTDILDSGVQADATKLVSRITNSVFDTNKTSVGSLSGVEGVARGGGLFVWACAGPVSSDVINCVFTANEATSIGGGIAHRAYYGNTITSNVENCTFIDNKTTGTTMNGGAIANLSERYLENTDKNVLTLTTTNCTFTGNTATGNGGAISNYVQGTKDKDNRSSTIDHTVTNCTFVNNTASGSSGSDIYNQSTKTIYHEGMTSKSDGTTEGTLNFNIYNTIVNAENVMEQLADATSATAVSIPDDNKNDYFASNPTTPTEPNGPEVVTGVVVKTVVKTGDTTTFEATTYKHTIFELKNDTTPDTTSSWRR